MIITYEWGGKFHDIEFDAMMRASDVQSSTITAHPVEKGSPVNDHIRKNADRFTVDAVVSDTPIREFNGDHATPGHVMSSKTPPVSNRGVDVTYDTIEHIDGVPGAGLGSTIQRRQNTTTLQIMNFDGEDFSRVRDVYNELKLIQDNGLPVSVKTTDVEGVGFRDYENMGIANLTTPIDAADGSSRTFQFQMQEIRIVETKKVKAPEAKQQAKHHGESGKKEVKEEEKQRATVAKQMKDGAEKGFNWLKSTFGVQ